MCKHHNRLRIDSWMNLNCLDVSRSVKMTDEGTMRKESTMPRRRRRRRIRRRSNSDLLAHSAPCTLSLRKTAALPPTAMPPSAFCAHVCGSYVRVRMCNASVRSLP